MVHRGSVGMPGRRAVLLLCVAFIGLLASILIPAAAQAQSKRLLLYTGTTGFRHTDGINGGRPIVQAALQTAGYTVDWEDCVNNGGGLATNCDNADKNPRIFTDTNLAKYDAIVLLNSSSGPPAVLWDAAQRAAIIKYVQNGGGIAGIHNATDMGTTATTWDWWDGNNGNSVVGSTISRPLPATRSASTRAASRSPRARSVRVSPTAWASRSRRPTCAGASGPR